MGRRQTAHVLGRGGEELEDPKSPASLWTTYSLCLSRLSSYSTPPTCCLSVLRVTGGAILTISMRVMYMGLSVAYEINKNAASSVTKRHDFRENELVM